MREFLGMPMLASAHGGEIDQIIFLVHYLMFALFIGWGLFFIVTLVKFRKSNNPKANYHGVKSHASSYLEVTVAVIEVVILVGFSIPFWAKKVNAIIPEADAVNVRVVAEQFAWNFHYAGADGVFGRTAPKFVDTATNPVGLDPEDPHGKDDITSVNNLHIPVNKPVLARLSSKDVIHSFGVPLMRVKQDAIPGQVIPFWFEPTQEGVFEIACSQLCGLGHYRMKGFINVHSMNDYDKWMAEEVAKKAEAASGGGDSFWN